MFVDLADVECNRVDEKLRRRRTLGGCTGLGSTSIRADAVVYAACMYVMCLLARPICIERHDLASGTLTIHSLSRMVFYFILFFVSD